MMIINRSTSVFAFALSFALFFLQNLPSAAQAPANDNFASATAIGVLPFNGPGTLVDATVEVGEPDHAPSFGNVATNSAWWTFIAPADGAYRVAVSGATFDHAIGIYTGTAVGALTVVGGADELGFADEETFFEVSGGTTYHVAVDGWSNGFVTPGAGAFNLIVEEFVPVNDDFANATSLGAVLPTILTGRNFAATAEAGEPDHANGFSGNIASKSLWYRWQAPTSGRVAVSCRGQDFDGVIGVYQGSTVAALLEIGFGDNFFASIRETVVFDALAGSEYYIAIDSYADLNAETAPATFQFAITQPTANDDFASAEDFGTVVRVDPIFGTTVGASAELDEPNHAESVFGNLATASVWYRWQAPLAAPMRVDIAASDGDFALAVYTGTALDSLTAVGADDRGGLSGGERVYFDAVEDGVYWIAVDASNANGSPLIDPLGDFFLSIVPTPANDAFANAIDLGSTSSATAVGDTTEATDERQYGELDHTFNIGFNRVSNSLWYRWEAPADGASNVTISEASLDSVLSVYTGTSIAALVSVAEVDDGFFGDNESVSFAAVAGTEYWIAVDGYTNNGIPNADGQGGFTLTVTGAVAELPYETWIANYPSLTGAAAERNATPQDDGVPNLVKLALGLDPTIPVWGDPNRDHLPRLVQFGGVDALQYTVIPGNLGSGANAIVHGGQTTDDYEGWDPVAAQNAAGDMWIIPLPVGGAGASRLSVVDPLTAP